MLLAGMCGYSRLNLRFHRLHVEAGALLHEWELDNALRCFCNLLLYEHKTPKLVGEPIVIGERPAFPVRQSRTLIRVQTKIDEDRPIDLLRGPQPLG